MYWIYDDHGIDAAEALMYGDRFHTIDYGIFGHEVKATKRSPPDNLMQQIMKGYWKDKQIR